MTQPTRPEIYMPVRQQTAWNQLFLLIRGDGSTASLLTPVRGAVVALDPEQPVYAIRTLEESIEAASFQQRISTVLLGVFAAVALLLAAVGIYGVLAFAAGQRAHELGIRAALGAGAWQLRWLIVKDGIRPSLIGLLIGLMGTTAATQVMASMLYGVESDDPLTIAAVAALLASVAGLACVLPVWRAATADPLETLKAR